jgi:ribosome biogenesis GTPase / thiamine phosphate phosphatase
MSVVRSTTSPSVLSEALRALGCSEGVLAALAERSGREDGVDQLARVVRVERSRSIAVGAEGRELRLQSSISTAVGDWVVVRESVIVALLPRRTTLERGDPERNSTQVLAANVDVVLVTAPADRLHFARVERELALAWRSGAAPLVVLSKADLAAPGTVAELRAHCGAVSVIAVSAQNRVGLDELGATLLPNLTAVMLGPSGSGKSTLVNALVGSDVLATGAVRDADRRGRHTTTSRQLLMMPGGGILIDTPGLRSLHLVGSLDEHVFPEIELLGSACRFSDCAHRTEPGCAVIAAVATGVLSADRLASYANLKVASAPKTRPHRSTARHGGASARRAYESSLDLDEERRTL